MQYLNVQNDGKGIFMKEIECSGKSVVSIIHIGCIFIFLILFTGILLYNRSIDVILGGVMILSCIYLIYLNYK